MLRRITIRAQSRFAARCKLGELSEDEKKRGEDACWDYLQSGKATLKACPPPVPEWKGATARIDATTRRFFIRLKGQKRETAWSDLRTITTRFHVVEAPSFELLMGTQQLLLLLAAV